MATDHAGQSSPKPLNLQSVFQTSFASQQEDASTNPNLPAPGEGTPVFTEEDLANAPTIIDRLIRHIYIRQGITRQILRVKHANYCSHELGSPQRVIHQDHTNLLKALYKGRATLRVLYLALAAIGFHLDNLSLKVRDRDGKIYRFSTTDGSDGRPRKPLQMIEVDEDDEGES